MVAWCRGTFRESDRCTKVHHISGSQSRARNLVGRSSRDAIVLSSIGNASRRTCMDPPFAPAYTPNQCRELNLANERFYYPDFWLRYSATQNDPGRKTLKHSIAWSESTGSSQPARARDKIAFVWAISRPLCETAAGNTGPFSRWLIAIGNLQALSLCREARFKHRDPRHSASSWPQMDFRLRCRKAANDAPWQVGAEFQLRH